MTPIVVVRRQRVKHLKGKFAPFYVMNAYSRTGGVSPHILILSTGQLYTSPVPIEQKAMWVDSRATPNISGKGKSTVLPRLEISFHPGCNPFTTVTTLTRPIIKQYYTKNSVDQCLTL